MEFPYGKAPLVILLLAVLAGGAILLGNVLGTGRGERKPDLVLATFVKEHALAYKAALPEFERKYGVKVQVQVVDQKALTQRLQSAMQAGASVPDMVEILDGTLGTFTMGPIDDVGFVDLTDRVHQTGLWEKLVNQRFGKWSSRGHIFALPHDLHPVMLAYRRDLVGKLGIDVSKLTTWDEFCRVGREVVTKDLDGDGVPDRYMIDLPTDGGDILRLLMLQHGGAVFTPDGKVAFDSPQTADVVCWYIKQIQGPGRIAFPCGWGQNLAKAMTDGLCLFYICPDWRSRQFELDVTSVSGRMGLMPLPAWEEGGKRTSTWGGTGLAFPKRCRNLELAWKLAMYLYYDPTQLGPRFAGTNILPPLKEAWKQPEFSQGQEFFGGEQVGRVYAALAEQVPQEVVTPYTRIAVNKLSSAFTSANVYYAEHGEAGLRPFVEAKLKEAADSVRETMRRNVFTREVAEATRGMGTDAPAAADRPTAAAMDAGSGR